MTLEQQLRALADGFPETPPLAPRVLAAAPRRSAVRRRRRRIALVALAVFLLVPATALAVSSDLRDRVLDAFGLRDVRITSVERLPEVDQALRPLSLGTRVTLAEAQRELGLKVRPPRLLGEPDGIFSDRLTSGVDVTFRYEPETVADRYKVPKLVLVSVVRGTIVKAVVGKTLQAATRTTRLEIEGAPALLLSGEPHALVLFRTRGGIEQVATRFAGTTLLWQRKAMLVRVEADLPQALLVAIARSISTG